MPTSFTRKKVLGHPNNRNALFDARIQDEAKRAAAKETIAALKKELKKDSRCSGRILPSNGSGAGTHDGSD